ncbi:MAG: hypothetical protein IJ877_04955 [Candidatus Gastranaerophilales bacterium]|nr:hypothetical protein [Candidatus Gastranaerophilales bacterium]
MSGKHLAITEKREAAVRNVERKRKDNMQIDKEKQFKKCRKCGYLSALITKPNGAEKFVEFDRKKMQDYNYYCKRNNNYSICDDFWHHLFFPKDLSTSEAINIQNKNRELRKKVSGFIINFFKWLIKTIIAFGMLYFAYLNYIK